MYTAMILSVRAISRSAHFERSAKLASSFEEVVQNKYKDPKKYKAKKQKLLFLHVIS